MVSVAIVGFVARLVWFSGDEARLAGEAADRSPASRGPDLKSEDLAKALTMMKGAAKDDLDQRERFEKEGWKIVPAVAPDLDVVRLNPAVLDTKEAEVQLQLQSVSLSAAQIDAAREIAVAAQSEKTRYVAVEALGRSTEPRAQEALISLYRELPRSRDRGLILEYMRPSSANDAVADFLVEQIGDDDVPLGLKEQASFPLIVMGLARGGGAIDPAVAERVPEEWQERFQNLAKKVREGSVRHHGEAH